MKQFKQLIVLILVTLLALGCLPGEATSVPPLDSPAAAATDTTAPIIPTPTELNATPAFDRPEAILILEPGPGSRVTSPLRVAGMADPTFEQSLVVTLLSAEGFALETTYTQIEAEMGQRGPFTIEVPFIVGQETQGFIQVYALSAKDGGVTHLSSAGVTLLPGGTASIRPASERPEQIILLYPKMGATVSDGIARIEGFGLASFEQTLLVEVLAEDGTVIASAPVTVTAPELGQPGPFAVNLPYTVTGPTSGRIQVRDVSPAHGGNTHLTSIEVRLEP